MVCAWHAGKFRVTEGQLGELRKLLAEHAEGINKLDNKPNDVSDAEEDTFDTALSKSSFLPNPAKQRVLSLAAKQLTSLLKDLKSLSDQPKSSDPSAEFFLAFSGPGRPGSIFLDPIQICDPPLKPRTFDPDSQVTVVATRSSKERESGRGVADTDDHRPLEKDRGQKARRSRKLREQRLRAEHQGRLPYPVEGKPDQGGDRRRPVRSRRARSSNTVGEGNLESPSSSQSSPPSMPPGGHSSGIMR